MPLRHHAKPRHLAHQPARRLYGCRAGFGMCNGPCGSLVSKSQISARWLTSDTARDELADLVLVREGTVDILSGQFDCRVPACPSYTSFAFAVAEIDLPPPSGAIQQLNDGKAHSLVFHETSLRTSFAKAMLVRSRLAQANAPVCALVYLTKVNIAVGALPVTASPWSFVSYLRPSAARLTGLPRRANQRANRSFRPAFLRKIFRFPVR
jgi:hypothetical protein